MNGGSSAPYLARTPCVPLFCTLFNRGGNRRAFRLPGGRAGIISIVQWNLRLVVFGVENRRRLLGEDAPRVSSRFFLAVKNVVKFSVTNLKPVFFFQKILTEILPSKSHQIFHSQISNFISLNFWDRSRAKKNLLNDSDLLFTKLRVFVGIHPYKFTRKLGRHILRNTFSGPKLRRFRMEGGRKKKPKQQVTACAGIVLHHPAT